MATNDPSTKKTKVTSKKKVSLKLTFEEATLLEFDEEHLEGFKAFLSNARLELPGFGRVAPSGFTIVEESADNSPAPIRVFSERLSEKSQVAPEPAETEKQYQPIRIATRCTNRANPTQYEGTINGQAFYFRYRHGFWSLIIYEAGGNGPYYVEGLAGSRQDGQMNENEVLTILRGCAHESINGRIPFKKRNQRFAIDDLYDAEHDRFNS